ncbi:MAG TPA: hypothetical protein PL137_13335 [Nocardioides sp.]|nr:hypothetical protein [Nocardioides sp.]
MSSTSAIPARTPNSSRAVSAMARIVVALVWLARRSRPAAPAAWVPTTSDSQRRAIRIVAVLALVAAVATSVQVYRVGDSGARAAWGDQVSD